MAKNAIHVSDVEMTKAATTSHAVKHEIIYAQSCLNAECVGMYLKGSRQIFSAFTSVMSSATFTSCDHCK